MENKDGGEGWGRLIERWGGGGGLIKITPIKRGGLIEELRYLFILVIFKKKN